MTKKKMLKPVVKVVPTPTKPAATKAVGSAPPAGTSTPTKAPQVKSTEAALLKAVRVSAPAAPLPAASKTVVKVVKTAITPKMEPVKAELAPVAKVVRATDLVNPPKSVPTARIVAPNPAPIAVAEPIIPKVCSEQSFELEAPSASNVLLTGDFTDWERQPIALKKEGNGCWRVRVSLDPGIYYYRFMVDGVWADDPNARSRVNNPFGSANCVREVQVS